MTNNSKLYFFGGSDTVSGSNFLLETGGKKYLIDCGLFQGFKYASDENRNPFSYNPKEIDALFVTHAHMDHIGRIPKLVRDGFIGNIYSTPETKEIVPLMFADALSLMEDEKKRGGLDPIYKKEDIERTMSLWRTSALGDELEIGESTVVFESSGHILGGATITFKGKKKSILFTGDLGNTNNLLLEEATIPKGIDYLLTESVYGDRNHESSSERKEKLKKAIVETLEKKGILIIPAFSLERTQHLLFEINNLVENGEVGQIPVYFDSPLAIKLTEIYKRNTSSFKDSVRKQIEEGDDIFDFPKLSLTRGREDSEEIWHTPSPKIILAGSGMSMGGRVVSHEKKYLSNPSTTILFVGYQAAGSLGRQLSEGSKKIFINGEKVEVRAKIMQVEGYSSHRDSDGLVDFVSKISPEKVFVAMGEPKAATFLAQRVREELGISAVVPERDSVYEIEL
jgi:metallo-beta-lactamase family protein